MNKRFSIFESVTIIFIFIGGMMAGNALTISSKTKDIKVDDGRIGGLDLRGIKRKGFENIRYWNGIRLYLTRIEEKYNQFQCLGT